MPIHPLPPSTISSLTATQVLAQPPSLIKELVENAIDANATFISVELATNCLDMLQVKDNGHGVLPGSDRDALCRRGWTSKISGWEEIERWKGSAVDEISRGGTLGFRGEALAAAAEMAGGGVEVITRVEGEKVGWVGTYNRAGELTSTNVRPIPVGMTVKVVDFLKNFPVRRETAIKSAAKHIQQIRRLLIAYALSHPQIRFSIKVHPARPKAKPSVDDNWVYSPSKTVQEAVMKIFGKEVLGGSLWVERGRGENEIEGNVEVEACMLKPGLDPSQLVKGKNPFISPMNFIFVDSRPISCSRPGPFKSLLSLYKVYLRSALSANCTHDMIPPVSDPFIYLNIRCKVPGMYDPNIEPVKDDVLFHNWEGDVFTVVDGMFRGVYGELKKKEKLEGVKRPMGIGAVDFGVLLARKPAPSISHPAPSPAPAVEELKVTNQVIKSVEAGLQEDIDEYPDSEIDHWDGLTPPIVDPAISEPNHFTIHLEGASNAGQRRPTWGFSMSTNLVEEDEVEDDPGAEYLPHPPTPPHEIEASRKDITLSNPWVMAKMNTPVTQHSSSSREPVAQKSSGSAGLGLAGGDGMGEKANAQTHRHSIYPKVKGIVGGGESSTAPQKPRGLDKWVVSTSTRGGELQASVSSFLMDSTSSHPSEGNPSVEAVRENASAADRVGGYTTREFMTAADLMASVKEPDSGATSYNTRFAGVDGPGGVIVQSRGERNRNPRDRALWPNPLERRPFSHPDSEDGDDRSLNSSLSPVAKRRRLDKGKGKARAYQHDFPGDSDEVLEVDEQLDLLFTHPPPHPQLPQRGQKQISAGVRPQRKFVPPLLNQVTISSNSGTCYLGEEQEEQEEEEQEEDENETLSEKSSSLSSVTSPSGITPLLARSPHKNRQRAATSTLSIPGKKNTGTVNLKGFKNIPNEGDASSALAQPTRLAKPRRKPRHLLPLERVAEEDRVHNTLVTVQLKRSILPSASTSSGEGGEAVAEQNFAAFVTRVVQWNLNEYSSQRRWDGTGKEFAFRGEWIDGVLNEWLRTKVAEREREEVELGKGKNEGVSMGEDIGSIWTRERELLGGVTRWVEKGRWEGGREGEEEGGGGEEEGSGGEEAVGMRVGLGVRKLWTVWV